MKFTDNFDECETQLEFILNASIPFMGDALIYDAGKTIDDKRRRFEHKETYDTRILAGMVIAGKYTLAGAALYILLYNCVK